MRITEIIITWKLKRQLDFIIISQLEHYMMI